MVKHFTRFCSAARNKMLHAGVARAMLLRMTTAMDRKRVPADTLPLRLVMLRYEAHVSQREAAFRCGITPRVWQGMEEGRNTANLLDVLQTVADEFGYDRNWLAYGGPLEKKNPRRPDDDGGGAEPPRGIEPLTYSLLGQDNDPQSVTIPAPVIPIRRRRTPDEPDREQERRAS